MWARGRFDGSLTINGLTERRPLYVFLPDECIFISDNELTTSQHRCLSFSPCTDGMLRSSDPEVIRRGKHYRISGRGIGGFREGRSFAYGDEEYDRRDVDEVLVELGYFADGIDVAVSGVAEPPSVNPKRLCKWEFSVKFTIPRAEVAKFFGLSKLGEETFASDYDKYAINRIPCT